MTLRSVFSRWTKSGAALAIASLVLFLFSVGPRADETSDKAGQFVRNLADQAIGSLTGQDVSQAQRNSRFRELFVANFDVAALGKSALGRYWQSASPDEQSEYLKVFEDYVVMTYAVRFREYTGEKLEVGDVAKAPGNVLAVKSQMVRPNGQPPVRIDWRLTSEGSSYKIVDVVIEGVSMVQTQRSEFASVVSRNGGKVSGLTAELREKTKSLHTP
jgi:phospholipid transport system substrate-binding protein